MENAFITVIMGVIWIWRAALVALALKTVLIVLLQSPVTSVRIITF